MEEHLITVGINNTEQLHSVGALEATKRIFLAGLAKPHVMYFMSLEAALQDRDIFSFEPIEKSELKLLYTELISEIGG